MPDLNAKNKNQETNSHLSLTKPLSAFTLMIPVLLMSQVLEGFTDELVCYILINLIAIVLIMLIKDSFASTYTIILSVMMGAYPPISLIIAPHWSLMSICTHFISLILACQGEYRFTSPRVWFISNSSMWIICCFCYSFSINTDFQNFKEAVPLFTDFHNLSQLTVSIALSYYLLYLFSHEKRLEASIRSDKEEQILSLNSQIAQSDDKLKIATDNLNEALTEKDNFVLRFSHEIRNPLNCLLGNVELCLENVRNHHEHIVLQDMLREAKISGEILLQLLNNILDTAKISSGRLEISIRSHDIREFAERAWIVCSEIIRRKGLYGALFMRTSMPEIVDFDNHRLMQILMNLVTNAAKFTDQGYVKVYVDFEEGVTIDKSQMKPRHLNLTNRSVETLENIFDGSNLEELAEKSRYNYENLTAVKKYFQIKIANTDNSYDQQIDTRYLETKTLKSLQNYNILPSPRPNYKLPVSPKQTEMAGFLRLEIVDSGCGMGKESLADLFKKFSQVNQEASKRQVGTGLGLWITKELIELMNGKVEAYSLPNTGTSFVIMIRSMSRPCTSANFDSTFASSSVIKTSVRIKLPTDPKNLQKLPKRVMVVEDIPYNQEINRKFLEKCGIDDITIANNGLEAVQLYQSKPQGYFSCIFMDVDMPIMNGKIATAKIREYEDKNGWQGVRIVIMTAYSEANTQQELLDSDGPYRANVFLSKPSSFEEMRNSLIGNSMYRGIRSIDMQNYKRNSEEEKKVRRKALTASPAVLLSQKQVILLVDNDIDNINTMTKMLTKCGINFLTANNAKEAIDVYSKNFHNIYLVLIECEMPGMSGFEAAKRIVAVQQTKSQSENSTSSASSNNIRNTAVIPEVVLIGLSHHSSLQYRNKCIKDGMTDLIVKPVTMSILKEVMKQRNIYFE